MSVHVSDELDSGIFQAEKRLKAAGVLCSNSSILSTAIHLGLSHVDDMVYQADEIGVQSYRDLIDLVDLDNTVYRDGRSFSFAVSALKLTSDDMFIRLFKEGIVLQHDISNLSSIEHELRRRSPELVSECISITETPLKRRYFIQDIYRSLYG